MATVKKIYRVNYRVQDQNNHFETVAADISSAITVADEYLTQQGMTDYEITGVFKQGEIVDDD